MGRNNWLWIHPRVGLDMNGIIGLIGGASLGGEGNKRLNLGLGLRALGYTEGISLNKGW